jgi:site-specific recombinase XerD
MPSIKLELGNYVTLRPRTDGSFRVFFQVPARLRPPGWPSLIPLPITGERRGQLSNADEVRRIQSDARDLLERLRQARLGQPRKRPGRSIDQLIETWQASSAYKDLKPRSRTHYGTYLKHIRAWDESCEPSHPDPTRITRADVEAMLSLWDKQPVTKRHVRKTFRLIMEQAISKGWRTDNPVAGIRLRRGKRSKVGVWEEDDINAYVAAAEDLGLVSIARIILMEWEIGQRLTDARLFRPGTDYDATGGVFRFWQAKTENYVTLRVSTKLRLLLDDACREGDLFLFRYEATGKAYTEERLIKAFAMVREAAVAKGARRLLMRWLRHSCVVQLARAGCEVPEIAAVTGHSLSSVTSILETYLPRDNKVAENAQRKRGLISNLGTERLDDGQKSNGSN